MDTRVKKALIYPLMLILVAASLMLLIWAYVVKCPFSIPRRTVLRERPLKIYENGRMYIETDLNDFNARLLSYLEQTSLLPQRLTVQGLACTFDETEPGSDDFYINIENKGLLKAVFSFHCLWELSIDKGVAEVVFSDIRLGKYNIPYIGHFFWRLLKLPESVTYDGSRANGLLLLSSIETEGDGKITLKYDYEPNMLAETLKGILVLSDNRKIEFHSESGKAEESLIKLAREKTVSPEDASLLIGRFEKSPETFFSLCLLLSDAGIRQLYTCFGEAYYNHVSPEALVEASENELDSGLNEFNKKFARLLLQFLYRNPDYVVLDGSIYVNGIAVTPETILAGTDDMPYDVSILADDRRIVAVYNISGERFERVVLPE